MAVLVNTNQGTHAASDCRTSSDMGTTPYSEKLHAPPKLKHAIETGGHGVRQGTKPIVDDKEVGNEDDKDQSSEFSLDLPPLSTQKAIVERVRIAQSLAALAQKLIDSYGKLKMTADLQILRRELARSHASLRELKSERDYLSIVTLVEAAVQNIDWKNIEMGELQQIYLSLLIGTIPKPVNFDDVNRQARQFRGHGVSTLPTFDIHDGEEEAEYDETDSAGS